MRMMKKLNTRYAAVEEKMEHHNVLKREAAEIMIIHDDSSIIHDIS